MLSPELTYTPLNINEGMPDAETENKMQVHLMVATLPKKKMTEFQEATTADPTLQTVALLTKHGWPDRKSKVPADEKKKPKSFKEKIHEADGIRFKNHKMIVSERLRPEVLKRTHESHLGIEKSKRRARDILYWPNINAHTVY